MAAAGGEVGAGEVTGAGGTIGAATGAGGAARVRVGSIGALYAFHGSSNQKIPC